jgi:transposase
VLSCGIAIFRFLVDGMQGWMPRARRSARKPAHLFADGAYDRTKPLDKAAFCDFVLEIVRRSDKDPGFKVLPRRWVVERTFGWMTRWRRARARL